jgi:hypothetical protein
MQNVLSTRIGALSILWAIFGNSVLASDAMFGGPSFSSDVGFNIGVSDDKKAFTATFSGLGVSIDAKGSAPIATRVFSFSLPLTGADPGAEIPFFVSGFVLSQKGASGHLLFSINDQTVVVDFPENSNNDFVQQLKFKVGYASELRIRVFLLADRDSKSDAAVNLSVQAIDTDIVKHKR